MVIRNALERNADLFPDAAVRRILAPAAVDGRLGELFRYAGNHGIPLYGLIDEYDNFANTVLAHRGREAYESFTHGGGFYRSITTGIGTVTGRGQNRWSSTKFASSTSRSECTRAITTASPARTMPRRASSGLSCPTTSRPAGATSGATLR